MEHAITPLRVGIADDSRSDRAILAELLRAIGHEVAFEAATARELIEKCVAERPDLIITDNIMPDMAGVDAAAQIYERTPLPVILVSVHADPGVVCAAEQSHVAVYLVKPVDETNLGAAIQLAVRRFAESQFGDDDLSPGPRGSKCRDDAECHGTIDDLGGRQTLAR